MTYTVIGHPEENLKRSLGRLGYWWLRNFVVYGAGSVRGQPLHFGPERVGELLRLYALGLTGRRLYKTAFLSKCKGSDKSGFGGYLSLFEAFGPCRFAGWADGGERYSFLGKTYKYRPGEPMGRPVVEPLIRCMATEEGQTGHVYDVALMNCQSGPLSELGIAAFDGYIQGPNGETILPSTSGATSKDGGRETFVLMDETHLWTTPRLKSAYRTVKRNQVKRPLEEQWLIELTTMYSPGEGSIAEETYALAESIAAGKVKRPNLLFMHRYAPLPEDQFDNEPAVRAAILEAQGEASEWLSVDDTLTAIYDTREPLRDSIRYYLNSLAGSATAWLSFNQIEAVKTTDRLKPGDEIALGFDGSLSDDSTALVACRLHDHLIQYLHLQECPEGAEGRIWSVDQDAVDAAVDMAFSEFQVKAFFADPPYYQDRVKVWEERYADQLIPYTPQNPIAFWTNRETAMVRAVELASTILLNKGAQIADQPSLLRHFRNARVGKRRGGDLIFKEMKGSPKKIDLAMASVLALSAAVHAETSRYRPKDKKDVNAGLLTTIDPSMLIPRFVKGR